jgi:predicted component of type VI protein secretion system
VAAKKPQSKYVFKPEMCDRIIELGKQGASQKMMFSDIGINKDVAATWKKNHPEFADALATAVTHSQAYWEREILANVNNKGFNSRLAEIALRGQFQEDYRETRDTKVDVKVEAVVDFAGEINKLIAALKE